MSRLRAHSLALQVVMLSACGPARPVATPAPSAAPAASPTCPPLDDASIAPKRRVLQTKVFRLGDLLPDREPPPAPGTPRRVSLGTLTYSRDADFPLPRDIPRFADFPTRAWFGGGLRASITELLDALVAAHTREEQLRRRIALLEREQRLVTHVAIERHGARDAEAARADECISVAYGAANGEHGRAMVAAADRDADVRAALEALKDRSAAESVLLQELVSGRGDLPPRYVMEDSRRSLLGRILSLTDDTTTTMGARLELLLHRAESAATRRARLTALVEPLASATSDRARSLLLVALGELGWTERELGDDLAAKRTFARCLADARPTEDDDLDPAGCAEGLAQMISWSGADGAAADILVPLDYAGAVGTRVMMDAIQSLDRAGARHAARFIVEHTPDAAEAPLALAWLAILAPTEDEGRAWLARRNRDYGSDSAWYEREGRFGAATAQKSHRQDLLVPTRKPPPPESTTDDGWTLELRDLRAPELASVCAKPLMDAKVTATVVIDTRGASPAVRALPATPDAPWVTCLERAGRNHFRSVPAGEFTVVLVP